MTTDEMTTLEDARKVLDAYLQTDKNDVAAIIANTKEVIRAYACFAHDAVFGAGFSRAESVFIVIGAMLAARGAHDALDDAEIDFVDSIVASTAAVVAVVKKEAAE